MTIVEEDDIKQKFIAGMPNKYDYAAYKQFCIDNNLWLMSFIQYASLIEPYEPPEVTEKNTSLGTAKSCCGGGNVK